MSSLDKLPPVEKITGDLNIDEVRGAFILGDEISDEFGIAFDDHTSKAILLGSILIASVIKKSLFDIDNSLCDISYRIETK